MMRIGNEYLTNDRLCEKKNDGDIPTDFSGVIDRIREKPEDKNAERDSFIKSIGSIEPDNLGVYTKNSVAQPTPQNIDFPIETERYKIENVSYVDGVPAYQVIDKLTGEGVYIKEEELVIQKDERTGMEFLINMDQPFSKVIVTNELRSILNDLSEKRNFDLQEVPLQGGLTVNTDPKTGLQYLAIRGNESKGASIILASEKDIETLEKLVDEFEAYTGERSIAGLYAVLEISGSLKREEDGFTILTPNTITYIPYDGNPENAWWIEMDDAAYPAARQRMLSGEPCADERFWENTLGEVKINYGNVAVSNRYVVDDLGKYFVFE